ncbi:zinc-dependent metalloprotease [Lacinutrix sp. Bg11-31]|uniref:zinc-dependent metalloprotease n=1 Tax=Lacinutrix sp. Bg11-31 TaxID=2057808 RepID=UPI000C30B050|nr:zinc-dependent metalloprotease [Lacinutrix sp. Bg11-31]AUC82282.1 hypothetical protein CW733_09135 [Lacinutrix sp. Bg11-31]
MKKTTLQLKSLTLLFFLTTIFSFAQQIEKCATDKLMEIERQKNPAMFDHNRAELEAFTRNYKLNNVSSKSSMMVTEIPTVIHVIHNGEAEGTYPNMSTVQLTSAIANLNAAFQNTGVYAGSTFYNSPMNVEFVLAKVKEDGTVTTGIERHNVAGKSYASEYDNNGISAGGVGVDSVVLFNDYFWNPQDYMNVWIVKKIDGVDIGTGNSGILGYATLPGTNPGVRDGLVCQARAFGYNPTYSSSNPGATPGYDFGSSLFPSSGNGTADHEVGHYLNLQHTFNGDNNGTVCPPVSGTVGADDDGCADIAPHKRTNSICPGDSATGNDCTGGSNENIHNFMDYSSDPCFTGFSNDQRTRVHAAVDGPRVAFKTSIAANAPSGNYPAAVANTPVKTVAGSFLGGVFEVSINGNTFKSLSEYNDGFYLNRVASQPTITLVENTVTNITVIAGLAGTNDELVDVYIDYNNDGAFATSERVHQSQPASAIAGAAVAISFTTPMVGGFVNNQKLRMRVISDFDNHGSTIANAYSTQIGNIEDYSVIFNPTLSVTDNEIEVGAISIYPNPANSVLNIKNASNKEITTLTIFDALGRSVYTNSGTNKVSVENLGDGVYFLKLDFENNNSVTKRFIKK